MKLVKTASGKMSIKISKQDWMNIGKKQGWVKEAQFEDDDGTNKEIGGYKAYLSGNTLEITYPKSNSKRVFIQIDDKTRTQLVGIAAWKDAPNPKYNDLS